MTEPTQPQQPPAPEASVEQVLGDEVIADARRRAERIGRRGQREAERIRKKAEKQAHEVAQAILDDAHQRAQHSAQMVLATLEVEAHKANLALREEVVQASLEAAWQKLLAKDDYDYPAALSRLAAAAVAQMPGEEFVLQLAQEDGDRLTDGLCERIEQAVRREKQREVKVRLSPEPSRFVGGCVVFSADGRLRYDNSFEARRRRLHQHLRQSAARALFADEETDRDHP